MYQEFRKKIEVTIGVPTKNRYTELSHTLLSIALQSRGDLIKEVIVVDNSDNLQDIRTIPHYAYILKLFYEKNIDWKWVFGKKLGQHHSHQLIQEMAISEYVFRMDDDCVLESDVIEKLVKLMTNDIGAIAPLVLMPSAESLKHPIQYLPTNAENNISNMYAPNIQWYRWFKNDVKVKEVDHLYSCFLYRKGIARYELGLSPKAHREESIFSHSIKRSGYKLLVNSEAVVFHFRNSIGGIRSNQKEDKEMFEHDERIFQGYLNRWNVKTSESKKYIILDNGIGDHYCCKNILSKLKLKQKNITIASCYPDVFFDEQGIELISIADAKNIFGDISQFNIYQKMTEWNWNKSLTEAFEKLYLG